MRPRLRRLAEMMALGALLFGLARALPEGPVELVVVIPPGASADQRARRAEEEALLTEARQRGLLVHDAFVLHRVAANLAAVGPADGPRATPETLLARAEALHMVDRDPLLRAHVLRRMRARGDVAEILGAYTPRFVEREPCP